MASRFSRRTFIKTSALAAGAVGAARFTALSYGKIAGSNDKIRVGVIGFNGRGNAHINELCSIDGVELVALCDADQNVLDKGYARVMKDANTQREAGAAAPKPSAPRLDKYRDLRKLLDDKNIDAISTATPNHWHALITVWACQAGKDVYVEKPVSHEVWEGRQMINAARKYGRIVQTGTQYRSNEAVTKAVEWLHQGNLGKVLVGRAIVYNHRDSIGKVDATPEVPKGIDLDLWCGPSPLQAPHREKFHYDWHWFWQTGNGEIGNNAIHEIDIVRWAMQKNTLSSSIISVGARLGYIDDGQTPNTQFAVHRYDDGALMVMEVRGLPSKPGSPKQDTYKGQEVGWVIECEKGYLSGPVAYDNDGKEIKTFGSVEGAKKTMQHSHFVNFIDAVRSQKVTDLHADIEQGHLSTALCHLPNISHRLGRESSLDDIKSRLNADPAATDALTRLAQHLEINEIDLTKTPLTVGVPLAFDPKTETFINNPSANHLLKRAYRSPFIMPEKV